MHHEIEENFAIELGGLPIMETIESVLELGDRVFGVAGDANGFYSLVAAAEVNPLGAISTAFLGGTDAGLKIIDLARSYDPNLQTDAETQAIEDSVSYYVIGNTQLGLTGGAAGACVVVALLGAIGAPVSLALGEAVALGAAFGGAFGSVVGTAAYAAHLLRHEL